MLLSHIIVYDFSSLIFCVVFDILDSAGVGHFPGQMPAKLKGDISPLQT